MHTDPIADLLNRIKNAALVKHETVMIPHSRIKNELAKILMAEGYLKDVEVKKRGSRGYLVLSIAYTDGIASLHGAERVSKPGRRLYTRANMLYPIKGGYGRAIVSTPKGLMTDKQARKERVGGEVLCLVW